MADFPPNGQLTRPPDNGSELPLEELREKRAEALRQMQHAEEQIDETQQIAMIYTQAAEQLQAKARELESRAKEARDSGDSHKSSKLVEEVFSMRKLAMEHARIADEKNRLAGRLAQTAAEARSLALKIATQIRKRVAQWDDWEL